MLILLIKWYLHWKIKATQEFRIEQWKKFTYSGRKSATRCIFNCDLSILRVNSKDKRVKFIRENWFLLNDSRYDTCINRFYTISWTINFTIILKKFHWIKRKNLAWVSSRKFSWFRKIFQRRLAKINGFTVCEMEKVAEHLKYSWRYEEYWKWVLIGQIKFRENIFIWNSNRLKLP